MIRLRKYIPPYVETGDDVIPTEEVANTREMLALPLFTGVAKNAGFHRWSMSDRYVMAEFDDGKKWYVVAIVIEGDIADPELPDWKRST